LNPVKGRREGEREGEEDEGLKNSKTHLGL